MCAIYHKYKEPQSILWQVFFLSYLLYEVKSLS